MSAMSARKLEARSYKTLTTMQQLSTDSYSNPTFVKPSSGDLRNDLQLSTILKRISSIVLCPGVTFLVFKVPVAYTSPMQITFALFQAVRLTTFSSDNVSQHPVSVSH